MLDTTPTSTAPRSPGRRNKLWIAAQIVIAAVVVVFISKSLVSQWRAFRGTPLTVAPNWLMLAAASGVVLAAYGVLIETWRRMLGAWDSTLSFRDAARIWSVSNLGRYVPGNVWQIGAMATMAERERVSPVAAAGSAILNTVVNIAVGFLVAIVAGWRSLDRLSNGHASLGIAVALLVVASVVLLPFALPYLLALARRLTGRALAIASIPHRAVYYSFAGNAIAWLMYGAAFELFVRGVVGPVPGSYAAFVTAWAWAYVLGYLFVIAPAGIGVRDSALALALTALGIATPPQALVVTVASRLWLTVLELLPGFAFVAVGARTRAKTSR